MQQLTSLRPARGLTLLVTLLLFGALARADQIDAAWRVADIGIGIKPSFDFDARGRFHVMGIRESFAGGVWYAVSADLAGPWDPQQVSLGYFYGPGDLRVGPDGSAHMAWHNHDESDPNHLVVYASGGTQQFRIASPGHNGWDNGLALDGSGALYQSSVNPFNGTESLEFSTFDGTAWTYDTVPDSGSFMYGFNTSIAIDSNDDPHIVYTNATNWTAPGDLGYASRHDGTWEVESVVTNAIGGRFPSIALDGADRPHVVWLDIDDTDTTRGFVRYGVLDNGVWSIATIDTLENVSLGFAGGRKQVSIALDADGRPHVAYGDRRLVKYAVRSGGDWIDTAVLESDDDLYNGLVVLRLNGRDQPGIAFWQDHPGDVGLVRLAFVPEPAGLAMAGALLGVWLGRRSRPGPRAHRTVNGRSAAAARCDAHA